ncbi:hypothetical protein [Bacillus toyonensis]|uniref:hypothetical protein n=1 Tax=Bacillus toyonensis TaxID=155322 RepID=UPI0011454DF6|nr:hypothetical protein [Bacillus toyonensis]
METKKIKLNKEYLENHKIGIHDYESFGRVFCEQIMNTVIEEVGDQEVDSHEIDLKVTVLGVTLERCVQACFWYKGKKHCIHIPRFYQV